MKDKNLILVCGPTAIGKTDIAINLARVLDTEIISADSRQFYREMNIGTAKPSPEQLAAVKHHLVGHLSIHNTYNVSRFEQDSLAILEGLFKTHDHAILCGGSGLYIDAVCSGIDDLPDADEALRARMNKQLQEEGITSLQAELKALDPEYYASVDPENPKRLMRAIEVCRLSGRKYSGLRKSKNKKRDFNIIRIGLNTDREILFERISRRNEQMIAEGLVEEARELYDQRELNALNTVGYKEIFQHFDGIWSLPLALEKIKTNTRRYAKRQLTWFKKDPSIQWFEPKDFDKILQFIKNKN
ncbi:MAG: tRNA (adenosine(37)-N6)-dimethylallyltransferase MiaA [Bacteroidota bacterium]|nr:tRNA (adenosine(37)-N6)-dimethylallyltransferase MiaA [Bacteroidota bacterium]